VRQPLTRVAKADTEPARRPVSLAPTVRHDDSETVALPPDAETHLARAPLRLQRELDRVLHERLKRQRRNRGVARSVVDLADDGERIGVARADDADVRVHHVELLVERHGGER